MSIPVLAVDFDGTLVENDWPNIGKPKEHIARYVRHLKYKGWKIILWTCRVDSALQAAVDFCRKELRIEFDAVNDNLPEDVIKYGSNSRKIHATKYLDDKAMLLSEVEAIQALQKGGKK